MARVPSDPRPAERRILVGSMAAGIPRDPTTVWLDLGPDHPGHAGLLELRVEEDEGIVTRATVVPGAMHRGVEKLFEVRDYRQVLSLADRHDWQAPFFGELAAATVVEAMMRLEVPPRAGWLRTLLAEHTRMLSHLGFLTWVARRSAPETGPSLRGWREELREQTRRLSGNRIHPMVVRIGGFGADASPQWLAAEAELVDRIAAGMAPLASLDLPGAGLGRVDAALVDAYGLSGPMARAAGVDLDLRRAATGGPYAELADLLPPPAAGAGDASARFALLVTEVVQSARLVRACTERLPAGPVEVRLPKIVKPPEDEAYAAVEAPLGRAGFHVVSRGDKTPWRMKLRTPSFHHVAALEALLPGTPTADVECVLASVGHVIGDLDK